MWKSKKVKLTDRDIEDLIFCVRENIHNVRLVPNKSWSERRLALIEKLLGESERRS